MDRLIWESCHTYDHRWCDVIYGYHAQGTFSYVLYTCTIGRYTLLVILSTPVELYGSFNPYKTSFELTYIKYELLTLEFVVCTEECINEDARKDKDTYTC